jgi:hypothetical protein
MATLDLKPMTQETIDQMAFNNHDLWLVKINQEVFGPFETESLKHYASENAEQFDAAFATRKDQEDFKPFWSHTLFQRRAPQLMKGDVHQGPFWLLNDGIKKGPLSYHEIDKKLEMGLLGMTDHISIDDGHSWKKIYDIHGFDRRIHSPDELPTLPVEETFQKGKLALVEKMEHQHPHTADQLATLAHIGQTEAKVIQFKVEEMTYESPKSTEVSRSLKWAVPAAMTGMIALAATGYFMFAGGSEDTAVVAEEKAKENFYRPKSPSNPQGFVPDARRAPASTGYSGQPAYQDQYQQESRYPTHMETHEQAYEEPQMEYDQPVAEEQPQEHSLVGGDAPVQQPEEQSLDAAMNGVNSSAPLEPPIEESSDF